MPGNEPDTSSLIQLYKNYHLNESKTFCMLPWIHLYTSPGGAAAPCCIAESCNGDIGVGSSRTQPLMELVNSEKMNKLRMDMLMNIKNDECIKCHRHDSQNIPSARKMYTKEYEQFYDEAVANTNPDGSLKDFKMRYYDVRFSNICNFKCRTCGSGFSSQWEQEDLKSKVHYARVVPKNDNPNFLEEIKKQASNFYSAYFAGGEPLITEEHYVLLEEMIRKKATYVKLRYNTNMSNLKFKNKDLLGLWKKFENPIEIYASVDHYGERAEYIRHGTDWAKVEENIIEAKKQSFIYLKMNTVLSVFNFCTIGNFYQYLLDKQLYTHKDQVYTLYNMSVPEHFTAHILPDNLKDVGRKSLESAIKLLGARHFKPYHIMQLQDALPWALLYNTWDKHKYAFRSEIRRVDRLRGELFENVFPEYRGLLDFDKRAPA